MGAWASPIPRLPCRRQGGRHPIFGTNPVAAIFPRRGADPLMIALSLSEVARGKLMVAAQQGPTPQGLQAAA
jgi:(2R)-3-sulfolactate dehydrogenase (NADP+)